MQKFWNCPESVCRGELNWSVLALTTSSQIHLSIGWCPDSSNTHTCTFVLWQTASRSQFLEMKQECFCIKTNLSEFVHKQNLIKIRALGDFYYRQHQFKTTGGAVTPETTVNRFLWYKSGFVFGISVWKCSSFQPLFHAKLFTQPRYWTVRGDGSSRMAGVCNQSQYGGIKTKLLSV